MTWADLEVAAPALATEGRRLLHRDGRGQGLLATVRGDEAPRIHPISFEIVDGRLYAFILRSAKLRDLDEDGRYALHSHQEPTAPSEFLIRGRAELMGDRSIRSAVAGEWSFEVDDTYALFEFSIDSALLGERGPDEWPPRYSSWQEAR